ncbi:MAG: kelch repeat-containing protein [Geodermatophilaceae bacterium]
MTEVRRLIPALMLVAALVACTGSDPTTGQGSDRPASVPSTGAPARSTDGFTALDPIVDRAAHAASLLPDGRVLITGGCVVDGCSEGTASTEIYDPVTQRFLEGPDMSVPRAGHTATSLPGGDVLLIGGYSGEGEPPLAAAELYDAASGSFVPGGQLSVARGGHMAALLNDGSVLVTGGSVGRRTLTDSAEIWDPTSRSFRTTGAMSIPRAAATATTLDDGSVLVAGGESTPGLGVDSSEIYQPQTGVWTAGPALSQARFKHAAVALADGSVLIVGGTSDDELLLTGVERYDGVAFRDEGRLGEGRYKFSDAVAVLPDGRVAIAGGGRTGESYDPLTGGIAPLAGPSGRRSSFATATLLRNGFLLVVGGYDERIDLLRAAYLLDAS